MEVKSSKLKVQSWRNSGFSSLALLVIIAIGIVIGGGSYWLYKNVGKKEISPTSEGKLTEPVETSETTKPATEKVVGTEEGKQSTKPESTAKPEAPSAKGNFSKKGAVVAREEGWMLIWDEPGQMATNVKLKFTDQSICILGGERKDCGLINQGPQSYDYASVEGNRNNDEVTVTKLEELKLPQ